ncbi:hypothetical protein ACF08N_13115 [Streptomyces sp. NPDC015127]|uniref:hypothetical protein n=1 Tax=Streptomyces sp. NPDC015127 TaxID=3364939 RepID=UPI0036F505EB
MSVSDDEGGKPAPSTSAERRGAAAEPDGGHGVPGGPQRGAGYGEEDPAGKDTEDAENAGDAKDAEESPSPSGAVSTGEPTPGGKPSKPATKPTPPQGGGSPAPTQQPTTQPPSEQPTPPASPTPQPSGTTDPPPASSAPEVHAGAMRAVEEPGPGHSGGDEPTASPQDSPA